MDFSYIQYVAIVYIVYIVTRISFCTLEFLIFVKKRKKELILHSTYCPVLSSSLGKSTVVALTVCSGTVMAL